jgi:hypothetical protein
LVSVEAREVVRVGVVILSGTPSGPGHKGGEASLPGELAGGRLASGVFGSLDSHSISYNCLDVSYSRMTLRSQGDYLPGGV